MIPAGTLVLIRGHRSAPGKGLTYFGGIATLAEDCAPGGWDVIDLTDGRSVYAFSVMPRPRARRVRS
jgi:hypothetical protein